MQLIRKTVISSGKCHMHDVTFRARGLLSLSTIFSHGKLVGKYFKILFISTLLSSLPNLFSEEVCSSTTLNLSVIF